MPKLRQRRVILVKLETTYGTDPSPVEGSDAILCRMSSSIDPQGEDVALQNAVTVATPQGHVVAGKHVSFTIEVDLKGGGSAGDAPECDALLQACGLVKSSTASDVTYTPSTDLSDHESVVIYWYEDGRLHKATGCKGNINLNAPVQQIGALTFNMMGIWVDVEDDTLPSPTLLDLDPPVVQGGTFTVGGSARYITNFSLDFSNEVIQRQDINSDEGILSFEITDRNPNGSFDPEDVDLSIWNPWTAWKNGTTAALQAVIGGTAGNITTVDISAAQYNRPSYADRNGIRIYNMNFVCTGSSDGEATIKFS